MVDHADARWHAALAVLDRINASASPAEVIREGLSLLVRQDRVLVRARPMAAEPVAAREVEVARALLAAEVPTAPLVAGRGQPWVEDGCVVTAWAWCEAVGAASPADVGSLARSLRERTGGTHAFDVPRFDPLAAIRGAVAHVPLGDQHGDFVRQRAHALAADWVRIADRDPAGTAVVHGDLHHENVVLTADGPVLTDLELAGSGPPAYDTAPAVVNVERYGADPGTLDAFLDAQGHDPRDWAGFATCLAVYELWVTAWAVGVQDRSSEALAEAARRVACLRDGSCEPWTLR